MNEQQLMQLKVMQAEAWSKIQSRLSVLFISSELCRDDNIAVLRKEVELHRKRIDAYVDSIDA